MPAPDGFQRVTRGHPCPVCEKPDWCMIKDDGSTVICARVPSPVAFGNNGAGWVHDHNRDWTVMSPPPRAEQPAKPASGPVPNFNVLQKQYRTAMTGVKLNRLSNTLGVTIPSLSEVRVGWEPELMVNTFPMYHPASMDIIGIRLRSVNGRKWAISGSRNGLFLPFTPPPVVKERIETLYIVEGPTDLCTLLDLGLYGIGRPDCASGHGLLQIFVNRWRPRRTVIIHDNDPTGTVASVNTVRGAMRLANVLREQRRLVYVVKPVRSKDLRSWVSDRNIDAACIEDLVSNSSGVA